MVQPIAKIIGIVLGVAVISPLILPVIALIVLVFPFLIGVALAVFFWYLVDNTESTPAVIFYIVSICCAVIAGLIVNVLLAGSLFNIGVEIVRLEYVAYLYFFAQ